MELPRKRTGSYEPRSAVGNILAPVSGPQGSAELRTTPSSRGGSSAAVASSSRPPWATELDAGDAPPTQPPVQHHHQQQLKPAGRSPSTSRTQNRQADRDPHGFSFHTPTPTPGRPQSNGRGAAPEDQLDLWSRQQHQEQHSPSQGRRSDGLYSRIEHTESPPLPPGGSAARRASGSGDGPRLPPGNLSYGDGGGVAAVPRSGAAAGRTTATAAARGVGASPARPAPAPAPGRSTSTPKPRPAVPPKRSTSITDNVRRDWVDAGTAERRAGGASAGAGAGRWDADPDGDDRGSWLLNGDHEPAHASKPPPRSREMNPESGPRPAADRRRQPERPSSAGRVSDNGFDSDGVERYPTSQPPPRRPPPHSPASVSGELDATLSPAGAAAAAAAPPLPPPSVMLGGSGCSSGGMSLGHGLSAGFASGGGGAAGRGSSGSRQGGSSAESARQVQALQEENTRLRDQVQHLERLLTVATPAAAAAATDAGRGRKGPAAAGPAAAGRPWSAGNADAAAPSIAAAAVGGVALQQYKSQVIQLQRQVALMSQELEARARLSFEAEGALLEMAARLQELTAASGGIRGAAGGAVLDLPGAAAEAAAGLGGSGSGGGGGGALSRDLLQQVHKWSKAMLGRLRSEKSESSKLFTQQAAADSLASQGGAHRGTQPAPWADTRSGGGGGGGAFTAGGDGGSYAPTWLVPFLPAGGNPFLMAGGAGDAAAAAASDDLAGAAGGGATAGHGVYGTSVAAIAGGQAALLADSLLAHRLELRLAAAAPRLAALAVLLKTQLLPAMPWLGLEAADRLQAEVGEAAESVAQSVEALVQLCSLLPAGAAVFGGGPVAQETRRRAAEVDAGRDSWLYGSPELLDAPEPPSPTVNDDGVISVPRLQAAIVPLLRDRKTGSKALADILEPVRSRSQSVAAKRAVLETELRWAARASALHAEHVSHLMMSVGMALQECRGAKDAAAIKSYFNAAAAVRQVLEAADALELHPCEACLKALVDMVRVHREALGRVPELLVNAPAADVEGRLLAKVEELHQGFKRAISRLEAHKRRHVDAVAGGGGGAGTATAGQGGDSDDDYDDDMDHFDDEAGGGGGREAGGGAGAVGSAPARRPPLPSAAGGSQLRLEQQQRQQQAAAAHAGKPPKPRPEWQG